MFVEKLNKKQEGFYVIKEEKDIQDGKWEGYLEHDNVNRESIVIYTGPNFTGTKVDNFFVSTPSEMPWKTYLKVFSNSEKIYVTYESQGDQVEAEDINQVQNVLADTVEDLNDYKAATDASINDLEIRTTNLEETRASKTYVDTELNKVYKKEEVFNKEEVIQRIQDIIGAAPEALDTLAEIAEALNNDPDFAATVTNLLSQKVDKVAGKGLSTEDYTTAEKQKLAGIEEGANKYIHPSTHPASMIVETSEKRFVSDIEKATWNAKETPAGAQQKADKAEQNAKAYTDAHEQKAAPHSGHETPAGAQAKVDAHANRTDNPHSVTKSQVGLGNVENYEVATQKDAEEGTATNKYMTPQRTKQAIDSLQAVKSVAGKTGIVTLSKSDVGLSNVDNVRQASKAEFDSHNEDFTRHITDEERTAWNAKETPAGAQAKADIAEANAKSYTDEHDQNTTKHITATERTNWNDANAKKHTHSNKSILDTITQTLINAWNSAVDHISDAVRHITSAERASWNAKETPAGAQAKADIAEQNAKAYADIVANTAETNAQNYADNKIDDLAGAGRTTETVKEVADDLVSHKANTANPHNVTKAQVGLANVDNVQQASKTEFIAHVNDAVKHVTSAERTVWNNKAEISDIPTKVSQLENDAEYVTQIELETYKSVNDQAIDDLDSRLTTVENNKAEKSYVDLELSKKADKTYVDTELEKKANKSDTYTKSETNSLIQALIDSAPETLNTLAKIANAINNDPDFATTINNLLAQLEANKLDKSLKGVAGGLAELDFTGRVPSSQLPSYVDDVLEYLSKNNFPAIGETGKIYVALDTNLIYRWSGSSYVEISPSLALGETSSTAYRGDRGKIAYDHSQTIGNPHQTTKADIGLGNVGNYRVATQAQAEAGSVNNVYMTPLRTKQAIDVLQAVKSVAGKTGHVTLTKDDVGLSNVDNVKQASKTEFDSHNNDTTRHITAEERTRWNNKAEVSQIPTKVSQLENDRGYVTQEELGNAGCGDMLKSIYDTDNDGKVDAAEAADSVPWDGVTGKPGTFPPSSHNHDDRYIKNTGGTIQNGDLYMDGGSVNYVRPDTTGGWARGFWWSKRDLTRIGGIGVLGSGETISKFYIGFGISPWQNSIVEIFSDSVNINGTIKQQGNEVWHKGKPLTWNDLKGV